MNTAPDTGGFAAVLHAIPVWVFILLAVLIAAGWRQARGGALAVERAVILPLAMCGLSVYGAWQTFGGHLPVFLLWLVVAVAVCAAVLRRPLPADLAYDAGRRKVLMPGSWTPMALMLGLFATKFAAGMAFGMQPRLRSSVPLLGVLALLYGLFGGAFAGRGLRLMAWLRHRTRPLRD